MGPCALFALSRDLAWINSPQIPEATGGIFFLKRESGFPCDPHAQRWKPRTSVRLYNLPKARLLSPLVDEARVSLLWLKLRTARPLEQRTAPEPTLGEPCDWPKPCIQYNNLGAGNHFLWRNAMAFLSLFRFLIQPRAERNRGLPPPFFPLGNRLERFFASVRRLNLFPVPGVAAKKSRGRTPKRAQAQRDRLIRTCAKPFA